MPYFFSFDPDSGIAMRELLSVVLVRGLNRSGRLYAEEIPASATLPRAVL
jgi:hypothetical protein